MSNNKKIEIKSKPKQKKKNHFNLMNLDKMKLEAGTHQYAFECQLTSMLPTSLEEKYGHIRYKMSVRFNEFWDQMPIHEELFTMIKPLNLNHLGNLHVI